MHESLFSTYRSLLIFEDAIRWRTELYGSRIEEMLSLYRFEGKGIRGHRCHIDLVVRARLPDPNWVAAWRHDHTRAKST
jgi:hypothetical protein